MAYIGRDIRTGAFRQLDDISSGFDGSDTTHTMQVNSTNVSVGDVNQILLSLGGVIQKPGTDFTVSGSTLTFTTAPAANTSFFAILLGSDNGGTVTPTDGSVTGDKLASTVTTSSNISLDGGTFVFNESGADKDFRIESDSNTHMLFVDAGNNMIGINESSPSSYYYNDLVVNSGDEGGITIVDTSGGQSSLAFADGTSGSARYSGRILYDHSTDKMRIGAGGNTYLNIDGNGHVTNAYQPAFQVRPSSNQNNMATSDTIVFGTEVFDQNSDFASNTFTAPVTGKYQLSFNIRLQQLQDDSSYALINIQTSNRTYQHILALAPHVDGDVGYQHFSNSLLCDMDANDTAYLVFQESGGTTGAVDVSATESDFTGFLAC